MKRRLFLAIFVMVAAFAVAVVSCKKDNETTKSETLAKAFTEIDNMDEYLISFKEKMLSAQNGEEFVNLEQAQRDLGNLLNFDFGDANYATNVFHRDTLFTKLVVSEGKVDLSQLAVSYKDAREQIAKAYSQVELPEKSVYTISCAIFQEAKDEDAGNVMMVLTTRGLNLTMKDMYTVPPFKTSIDTSDCWRVFFLQGRCNGTDVGYDHCSILEMVYNNNIPDFTCVQGRVYYTDETQDLFDATQYFDFGTLNYRLWTGTLDDMQNGTVDPATMSYYYNNLCSILSTRMASLTDYRILGISCTIIQKPSSSYAFQCKSEIAKPHCTEIPID